MPTHDETDAFWREFDRLSPEEQERFLQAVSEFVRLLKQGFLPSKMPKRFGIKRFHGHSGDLWEFRWGSDRRALFRYGTSPNAGDVHIIWVSIGTHDIYNA
jgi:hypothetical protein